VEALIIFCFCDIRYVLMGNKVREALGDQLCAQVVTFLQLLTATSPDEGTLRMLAAGGSSDATSSSMGHLMKVKKTK
jgi:hypothetical protein